ncbi:MAG: phosphate acyltransferase PlsX [Clostridia bacterium]|nr:phosphate acyltransferase PlsX [Clostridia bacterium]
MKIIVDTMGSDKGCAEIVSGSLDAVREYNVEVVLVGDETLISPIVEASGLSDKVEIVHAPDYVSMEDDPTSVRSAKKTSSMVNAMKLIKQGKGDAVVTAGNTGAAITAATLYVGRIRGVRRAAIGTILPLNGGAILMDSGANVECTPEYLLQFGYMGSIYAKSVLNIDSPRVGLLNVGAEETKGDEIHLAAHGLLKKATEDGGINFVGNVEARYIPNSVADVIVADGFSGNVMLKSFEGIGMFFASQLKEKLKSNLITKIGALLVKKRIYELKKLLDYKEVGGSPLVGISAPVIKAHGSSNAYSFKNAIRQAIRYAEGNVIADIEANISAMKVSE